MKARSFPQVDSAQTAVLQMLEHRKPCHCSRALPFQTELAVVAMSAPPLVAEAAVEVMEHVVAAWHVRAEGPCTLDVAAASCTSAFAEDSH